ncbi:MAG TPA: cbb3-type cytochrome c oxidase subunit I [Candidatus Saccharimonadales bacterium]|nr:cbb3-type cytochrome c oxidase subunit I [Candidatus Saccharimonadales bacterium]
MIVEFGSLLLGRLTLSAFHHDVVTTGGVLTMILTLLAVAGLLTYKRRWGWLYRKWLTSLDPKKIGVMYLITALIMLLRGGADAVMMRAQQATSVGTAHGFLSASQFQQVFSAHGTIMIFFAAMGLMFGLINLVVPLQLGARDVAFPFLNATSFWLYAAGAVLVNVSLPIGEFSAAGWLAYPPLSELRYSPGVGIDYWIWSLQIAGVGSLLSGINFTATILGMRAKGMTLMRMPMFCWSVLGAMSLVIFAFPILTVTLSLLALDRLVGTHFFTAGDGGSAMMYVNLIWAWGHPEVYILILPAFGVFSEVVATFSRKHLFGYTSMVWAIWAIVLLSFTVWLHHFFTMGAGADVNAFFGIATMVIAIPTGVKIFNWLFTMYQGRIHFATPMYWFMGFLFTFTVGGVAGVVLAMPPADFQLHNSLFLVAHFHTMIIGGVVFGYLAGITYWFPKFFGFRLNERLGRYAFWCWQIGYGLAFIPLYVLGLMGATRRLDHYSASLGWHPLFVVAGVGVGFIGLGIGCQILQLLVSILQSRRNRQNVASSDPWNGRTLEWSTTSPPPEYNFAVLPVVQERDAFWAMKQHHTRAAKPVYTAIDIPKNTPLPMILAGLVLMAGFGIVWHIFWLAGLAGLAGFGILITFIIRTTQDDTEHRLSAATIERLEAAAKEQYA